MRPARSVASPFWSRVMTAGATGGGGPSTTASLTGRDTAPAGETAGCRTGACGSPVSARAAANGVRHSSATAMTAPRTLLLDGENGQGGSHRERRGQRREGGRGLERVYHPHTR